MDQRVKHIPPDIFGYSETDHCFTFPILFCFGIFMIKSYVDQKALLELLKEMVRINSVNPSLVPGAPGESEIANYLANYMENLGMEVSLDEVQPGRVNAVGVLKGVGGGKTLLLNGHSDTVGTHYMPNDPFNPIIKDGKMYGRGTYDMKAGLAASIGALKAVIDSGEELEGDVIVAAVCDEEFASIGTEKLMEQTVADAAIVGEPTALNVQIAHKGFAWINIETHGLAAHGSLYEIGVDAITKMGKVLTRLEQLDKDLKKKKHHLLTSPSIHASIIGGGRELSTYPDHCKLQLERRTIPGEDEDYIDNEIKQMLSFIANHDPKFSANFDITFVRGAMEVDPHEEICQLLQKTTQKITGSVPRFIGGFGWMDTEIIFNKGIPAVAYGPKGFGAHAAEEWVELESIMNTAKVQEYVIKKFCKVS
ncbi:MAG: ArgE/DapE family deacylase [Promethearchaeota archaeon]